MSRPILYYFAPQSPWTYLGHARFSALLKQSRRDVSVLPTDMMKVFSVSGGLPLPQRAPQRQAYRLQELKRWSAHLDLPLNLQPRHFPVNERAAAQLITAVAQIDGPDAAMVLAGSMLAACWAQDRDISAESTLLELLSECDLPDERLGQSREPQVELRYDAHTQAAIDQGIFGAPTYVVDGEPFWGQDRLEFVARKLGL